MADEVRYFMIIPFTKTTKILSPGGAIWDYPLPTEDIGIAYQILDGRGPRKGAYLNTVCHEVYFIISGTATFHIKGAKWDVKENDLVIIEPNTPHSVEAKNLKYITITRPNWYEEQYKAV